MKKIIIISALVVVALFFLTEKKTGTIKSWLTPIPGK